jgi:hypothetical protein
VLRATRLRAGNHLHQESKIITFWPAKFQLQHFSSTFDTLHAVSNQNNGSRPAPADNMGTSLQ